MIRVIALLASLAMVMSAPAPENCVGCSSRTAFSSASLKPSHVTTTPGEDSIWIIADDSASATKRVIGVDASSGNFHAIAELFNTPSVLDLESDAAALYIATEGEIVRIEKTSGRKETIASMDSPADIQVDATHVYWIAGNQLQRVEKSGGMVETIYSADAGRVLFSFVVDDIDVFFAELAANRYVLRSIGKRDGNLRYLSTLPAASALAVDDHWVYVGVSAAIARVPKTGGTAEEFAPLTPFVELATPSVDEMTVRDGRVLVRQVNAILRGCASETMAEYSAGGRVQPLSALGGDFVVTSCSLIYVPTPCFLNQRQPPFTVERVCLGAPGDSRRRATRR